KLQVRIGGFCRYMEIIGSRSHQDAAALHPGSGSVIQREENLLVRVTDRSMDDIGSDASERKFHGNLIIAIDLERIPILVAQFIADDFSIGIHYSAKIDRCRLCR